MTDTPTPELFDAVDVDISAGTVHLMSTSLTRRNVDAVIDMAVTRRNEEGHFYACTRAGAYIDGDKWEGQK